MISSKTNMKPRARYHNSRDKICLPNIIDLKQYPSHNAKELAKFFKEEGNKFFNRKEFDIAIIYYTKAIDHDNVNKTLYANRSACYLAKGSYRLAVKDALKSIEMDQNFVNGYYRGSLAYLEMDEVQLASALLEKFFSLPKQILKDDNELILLQGIIEKKRTEQSEMKKKFKSYEKFLNFSLALHMGDAFFPKLEIQFYSDNHRGVVAKQRINKNEIVLIMPKDLLISIEVAASSELGKTIASFMYKELNSPKHSLLTAYILSEKAKGDTSKWKFYLDILPQNFSNFPIFFTDDELALLQGSPFLTQIYEKKIDIRKDYDRICTFIPDFHRFSFPEFCEARMAVSSRIFGVKIESKKTDVLAPYADLLNHKRPRQTHWYYDEKCSAFLIQALEDIHIGDEIFDSYGRKCNSRFFLNYGFILENNDANEYPLIVQFNKTSPRFSEKSIVFKSEEEYIKKFRICANLGDYQVIDLFSFLRFTLYDGDMSVLYKMINDNPCMEFEDGSSGFFIISPISVELEIQVLTYLRDIVFECLEKYETSLEEDEKLLRSQNFSQNKRNCILMRMSEKEVLTFFLEFTMYCLDLFSLNDTQIHDRVLCDFQMDECPYAFYIHEVIFTLFNKSKDHTIRIGVSHT